MYVLNDFASQLCSPYILTFDQVDAVEFKGNENENLGRVFFYQQNIHLVKGIERNNKEEEGVRRDPFFIYIDVRIFPYVPSINVVWGYTHMLILAHARRSWLQNLHIIIHNKKQVTINEMPAFSTLK
jgi:hypothetical protein